MNNQLENKIINLVSGNIEGKERDELIKQIKSDPLLLKKYQEIKNAWALSTYSNRMSQESIDSSYSHFVKNISSRKRIQLYTYVKYAAIMILFFSIGIISNKYIFNNEGKSSNFSFLMNEISVPNGDKAELTLVDGTKVWLNSGTEFSFPSEFKGKLRKVIISGEAFFEVTKNKKKPFVVNTDFGDIKVLGTSFNVRAYENMNFQANLVEGSIQFSKDSIGKLLKPGEQLMINDNKEIIISKFTNPSSYTWKDGVITFQNEMLENVIKKLERHYDITIQLDSKLSSIRFTGKIYNESIEEVMILINKIEPINYKYTKDLNDLVISRKSN